MNNQNIYRHCPMHTKNNTDYRLWIEWMNSHFLVGVQVSCWRIKSTFNRHKTLEVIALLLDEKTAYVTAKFLLKTPSCIGSHLVHIILIMVFVTFLFSLFFVRFWYLLLLCCILYFSQYHVHSAHTSENLFSHKSYTKEKSVESNNLYETKTSREKKKKKIKENETKTKREKKINRDKNL